MKVKYEYECISQSDEVVAKGEFYLNLDSISNIRNPEIVTQGHFGLMRHEREMCSIYRGANHLKEVRLQATNVLTGTTRVLTERRPSWTTSN